MGLREALQKAISGGFDGLGNIPEQVSFDHIVSASYDVSAGAASTVEHRYLVSGVFSRYKDAETSYPPTSINPQTDLKFISPRLDWAFVPTTRDSISRLENEVTVAYEVRAVATDPAEATYNLQVRRRG